VERGDSAIVYGNFSIINADTCAMHLGAFCQSLLKFYSRPITVLHHVGCTENS